MNKLNLLLLLFSFFLGFETVDGQISLLDKVTGKNSFPLISSFSNAVICYDSKDETVVKTSVSLFIDDVVKVTGEKIKSIENQNTLSKTKYAIIVGTVGKSQWIDNLIAKKKIDVSEIYEGWEQYSVKLVNNPIPGLKKAIVIAGSDRRGTAYGLLSLSEQ